MKPIVVFENEHFIFIDKAAGVLSTPSRFADEDGRECLGTYLQDTLKIQIFPVHRLDFEVSGLVMYAKNASAHRTANGWFEKKQVFKSYRAWTTAQDFSHIPAQVANSRELIDLTKQTEFEWRGSLLRGKKRSFQSPQGKFSHTLAVFLGLNSQGYLIWDLNPITGRSHQLRVDLSRHGFPIVGDQLYGSKVVLVKDQIALRSYQIDFSKAPKHESFGLPNKIVVEETPLLGLPIT